MSERLTTPTTVTVPQNEQLRVETAAASTAPTGLRAQLSRAGEVRNLGLVVVLLLLGVLGTATSGNFLTTGNLRNILVSSAVIGVVSVGMTFVIIGGGIDLSVGAITALATVWATTQATQDYGAVVMVICALTVGTLAGLVNGLLVAYGRLVPFIATLAMMVSARGLAANLADNKSQVVQAEGIRNINRADFLGIPKLVLILAAVVAVGWVVLNRTTFGRRTYAIGGNAEAARLAGINVRAQTAMLYVVSGLCSGIAAVMVLARTTTGTSTHGNLYELQAIAAVIIGGTLLSGGRGTLVGSLLGVLVFTTITNIFILNNLETSVQQIAQGLIIVAAVLVQSRGGRGRAT